MNSLAAALHRSILALSLCLAMAAQAQPASSPPPPPGTAVNATLRVAAVQMRSSADPRANVEKIKQHLAELAARQVKIVAFPECAVSSYSASAILAIPPEELVRAEKEIAEACRQNGITAVAGMPEWREGRLFNLALVVDARGQIVTRYRKSQLVGQDHAWQCKAGGALPDVFPVAPTRAAVIVCHDSRYPELCRLPVAAGARVVFYISHEAPLSRESKIGPYRAQVQARAVENDVFVVHANAPADDLKTGSHGQSRIVAPDGNIVQEASMLEEEVLVADLKLAQATAERALRSLEGPVGEWWRAGVRQVRVLE